MRVSEREIGSSNNKTKSKADIKSEEESAKKRGHTYGVDKKKKRKADKSAEIMQMKTNQVH